MSSRPFFFAFCFSACSGILLSVLAVSGRIGAPWVALEVPETVPGRELEERLRNAGIVSVSAFSVSVLLNDFDGIREVPLDRYGDYVEASDPRNDGYAHRLCSFFSAEGKCRFFLRSGFGLKRKLVKLLGRPKPSGSSGLFGSSGNMSPDNSDAVSGSWVLETQAAFPPVVCAAFIIAVLLFIILETGPPVRRSPSVRRSSGRGETGFRFGAFCAVPVLFPLALTGAPGLAASGFFVILFHVTKPVLREYFRREKKRFHPMTGKDYRELAGLYPLHCALSLGVFPCYILCCLVGGINPVVAFSQPLFFCVSLFLSYRAEASVERNVFFPLPIGGRIKLRALFPPALPVFLAAFAAALLQPVSPPSLRSDFYGPLPGPEEYAVHAEFQASFARRSLYGETNYGTYPTGEDGLISGFIPEPPLPLPSLPSYPPELEELSRLFPDRGGQR
jgi:hypothetical protein